MDEEGKIEEEEEEEVVNEGREARHVSRLLQDMYKTSEVTLLLLLALGGGLGGGGISRRSRTAFLLLVQGGVAAGVLEHEGEVALAAVVPVEVHSHEDASAALGALFPQARHLAAGLVHLVVLKHRQLHLLMLGLDLLGLGVCLLLALLATTQELKVAAYHQLSGTLWFTQSGVPPP